MKNLLFIFFLVAGMSFGSQAQDYDAAVGLRLGSPVSISYKKFISESNAVEVYGGFRSYFGYSIIQANAAYLIHNELGDVGGLKWYYGGGAGLALYSYDLGFSDSGGVGAIISGYLGLEYTLEDIPLSLSLDWTPSLFVGGNGRFGADNGALAIRYVLGK